MKLPLILDVSRSPLIFSKQSFVVWCKSSDSTGVSSELLQIYVFADFLRMFLCSTNDVT